MFDAQNTSSSSRIEQSPYVEVDRSRLFEKRAEMLAYLERVFAEVKLSLFGEESAKIMEELKTAHTTLANSHPKTDAERAAQERNVEDFMQISFREMDATKESGGAIRNDAAGAIVKQIKQGPSGGESSEKAAVIARTYAEIIKNEPQGDPEKILYLEKVTGFLSAFFGYSSGEKKDLDHEKIALAVDRFKDRLTVLRAGGGTGGTPGNFVRMVKDKTHHLGSSENTDGHSLEAVHHFFGDAIKLPKNDVQAWLDTNEHGLSTVIHDNLSKLVSGFRGAELPKATVLGIVKAAQKAERTPNPEVQKELRNLATFVDSLEAVLTPEEIHGEAYTDLATLPEDHILSHLGTSLRNGRGMLNNPWVNRMMSDTMARTWINEIGADDLEEIIHLAIDFGGSKTAIGDMGIRVGIGGFVKPVPLRIASYVMGAMEMASRFEERFGVAPHVEVFTGQEGAIACNEMDGNLVRGNTKQAFDFMRRFVESTYPALADQFSTVDDIPWETSEKTKALLDYFVKIIEEKGNDVYLAKIGEELRKRGRERGGEEGEDNSMRYAVFHALCFCDIPAITQYLRNSTHLKRIVTIGAGAEREYTYVRKILTDEFSAEGFNEWLRENDKNHLSMEEGQGPLKTRASMIMDVGGMPPYYLGEEGGDLALDELRNAQTVDEAMELVRRRVEAASKIGTETDFRGGKIPRNVVEARAFVRGLASMVSRVSISKLWEISRS